MNHIHERLRATFALEAGFADHISPLEEIGFSGAPRKTHSERVGHGGVSTSTSASSLNLQHTGGTIMPRFISIVASGLLVIFYTAFPAPSLAGDNPNILIMGEDADQDAVPRHSGAFESVFAALSNQLRDEGFNVLDETAALGGLSGGRVQRTDAQVIEIARAVEDPAIDAAVVFSVHARVKHAFYQTRVIARIPGRLLNVKTGERLGDFQIELPKYKADRNWYAKTLCRTECILEVVGKNAPIVAEGLGAALAERLSVIRSEEPE